MVYKLFGWNNFKLLLKIISDPHTYYILRYALLGSWNNFRNTLSGEWRKAKIQKKYMCVCTIWIFIFKFLKVVWSLSGFRNLYEYNIGQNSLIWIGSNKEMILSNILCSDLYHELLEYCIKNFYLAWGKFSSEKNHMKKLV